MFPLNAWVTPLGTAMVSTVARPASRSSRYWCPDRTPLTFRVLVVVQAVQSEWTPFMSSVPSVASQTPPVPSEAGAPEVGVVRQLQRAVGNVRPRAVKELSELPTIKMPPP